MSGDLDRRLQALAEAVELADGRLEDRRVEAARAVVQRAGQRLGLGVDETVVALAGPTGAGKSSVFNALVGRDVVDVSRRRPTTSVATAAVWGDAGSELLDWLGVARRHRVAEADPTGLVLLDLPDYDSVETGHRLEVERLIELVDLLVWVLDPQKYADASLHDRYLKRLTEHGESMVVALNQADLLPDSAVDACLDDLGRLLREDGLSGVPVLAVSARTGAGLPVLRDELARRVARRTAAAARLGADVTTVAGALRAGSAGGSSPGVDAGHREALVAALSFAAGVPTVVDAVARSHRRRGVLAAGWPFVRWVRRLRPDPLRRLRLEARPTPDVHTSIPPPTPVQRGRASAATRQLAARAAADLPPPWPSLVRSSATAREDELAERLDRAVAGADLHVSTPRWWRLAGWLQRMLALVAVAGALWLIALALLGGLLRLDDVLPVPDVRGIPIPTALLLGGAGAGVLLAFLARLVNGVGARRRARAAERSLRKRVAAVGEELVIAPVEAELAAHDRMYGALERALGQDGRGPLRRRLPEGARRRPRAAAV